MLKETVTEFIKRGVLGFILGVFISTTLTIIDSLLFAHGNYIAVAPDLVSLCGSQLTAVTLQYLLSGILGIVFGTTTLIWENEKWSLLIQTLLHFFITTSVMTVIALICKWIPGTLGGIIGWIIVFVVVYLIVWFICYSIYKRKVKEINRLHFSENSDQ